jgi:uncharacterized protein (TIGR02996 family)
MTSEEDFQRHLDQNPDDHNTRLVFADWLEERGDPRANGYRALGKLQKQPYRYRYNFIDDPESTNIDHTWFELGLEPDSSHFEIPKDWLNLVQGHDQHYIHHLSGSNSIESKIFVNRPRQHAEDAAAHAFNQLPLERQAELLGHQPGQFKRRRLIKKYASTTVSRARDTTNYSSGIAGSRLGIVLNEIEHHPSLGGSNKHLAQLAQEAGGSFYPDKFVELRNALMLHDRNKKGRAYELATQYNWHNVGKKLTLDSAIAQFVRKASKGIHPEHQLQRRFYNGIEHGIGGVNEEQRKQWYEAIRKHLYHTGALKDHTYKDIQDSLRRNAETEHHRENTNWKVDKDGNTVRRHGNEKYTVPEYETPAWERNPRARNRNTHSVLSNIQPGQFKRCRLIKRYAIIGKYLPNKHIPHVENEVFNDAIHRAMLQEGLVPPKSSGESEPDYMNRVMKDHVPAYAEVARNYLNTHGPGDPITGKYIETARLLGRHSHFLNPQLGRYLVPGVAGLVRYLGQYHFNDKQYQFGNPTDVDLANPEHHATPLELAGAFPYEELKGTEKFPLTEESGTNPDELGFKLPQPVHIIPPEVRVKRKPYPNRNDIYKSIAEHNELGWSAPNNLKDYLVEKHGISPEEANIHITNFRRRTNKPTPNIPKPTKRVWPPIQRKSRTHLIDLMAIPSLKKYASSDGLNKGDKKKWYNGKKQGHKSYPKGRNPEEIGEWHNPDEDFNLTDGEPEEPEEPVKNSAYRAPKGGIIVRGSQYKGGEIIPNLNSKFINPRRKLARQVKKHERRSTSIYR